MNTLGHSAGPWKFLYKQSPETIEALTIPAEQDELDGKGWISKTISVGNANSECLAEVKAYTTEGFIQDFDEWAANSKLIVTAPELLAALIETINQLENNLSGNPFYEMSKTAAVEESNNWYAQAIAAIDKATK